LHRQPVGPPEPLLRRRQRGRPHRRRRGPPPRRRRPAADLRARGARPTHGRWNRPAKPNASHGRRPGAASRPVRIAGHWLRRLYTTSRKATGSPSGCTSRLHIIVLFADLCARLIDAVERWAADAAAELADWPSTAGLGATPATTRR